MTAPLLIPMPGNERLAGGLAAKLGSEVGQIEMRQFPDGERIRICTATAHWPKSTQSQRASFTPLR